MQVLRRCRGLAVRGRALQRSTDVHIAEHRPDISGIQPHQIQKVVEQRDRVIGRLVDFARRLFGDLRRFSAHQTFGPAKHTGE